MNRTERVLTGIVRVAVAAPGYFVVHTDAKEAWLKTIYLQPWALRSAKIGDRVQLAYRSHGSGAVWVVAEVLSR